VSYLSQLKGERDKKDLKGTEGEIRGAELGKSSSEISTLGRGMQLTGNIVCDGAVQIFGRVVGDIHAAQLVVCEGAQVEGKVVAQDTAIHGVFKGTLHSNSVKLQGMAVVDGEIFNKSLTIEPNVQFEGVSRRLDKPVDAPSSVPARSERLATVAEVVPISGAAG
jgi:cytoskeletal protein CcmA (bactofilin family)